LQEVNKLQDLYFAYFSKRSKLAQISHKDVFKMLREAHYMILKIWNILYFQDTVSLC